MPRDLDVFVLVAVAVAVAPILAKTPAGKVCANKDWFIRTSDPLKATSYSECFDRRRRGPVPFHLFQVLIPLSPRYYSLAPRFFRTSFASSDRMQWGLLHNKWTSVDLFNKPEFPQFLPRATGNVLEVQQAGDAALLVLLSLHERNISTISRLIWAASESRPTRPVPPSPAFEHEHLRVSPILQGCSSLTLSSPLSLSLFPGQHWLALTPAQCMVSTVVRGPTTLARSALPLPQPRIHLATLPTPGNLKWGSMLALVPQIRHQQRPPPRHLTALAMLVHLIY
mmetsp:Transcript_40405/g.94573  ORF Transcript_40405/g.94573 Transcript_40405/m.94573 type:complete len:282 (-) Transcript_40405:1829-2674(-)